MHTLVNELGAIRERSWYREKDFRAHRRVVGGDCWVTDILEGDYYLDGERYERALECYRSAADRHPRNPWPFLRMGKRASCRSATEAERDFASVTDIVPAYYGGWLKRARASWPWAGVRRRASAPKGRAPQPVRFQDTEYTEAVEMRAGRSQKATITIVAPSVHPSSATRTARSRPRRPR